jgi:hypothetical protein
LNFDHNAFQDERPHSACRQPMVPFAIAPEPDIRGNVIPWCHPSTSAG